MDVSFGELPFNAVHGRFEISTTLILYIIELYWSRPSVLPPFLGWGNRGPRYISDLPQVTWLKVLEISYNSYVPP